MAVLTIGPKMSKDKLIQATGRMRQLDKGQQRINLLATPVRLLADPITSAALRIRP